MQVVLLVIWPVLYLAVYLSYMYMTVRSFKRRSLLYLRISGQVARLQVCCPPFLARWHFSTVQSQAGLARHAANLQQQAIRRSCCMWAVSLPWHAAVLSSKKMFLTDHQVLL